MKKLLTFLFFSIVSLSFAQTPIENYISNLPKESLSKEEIKHLKYMREEEKLARDVYITLYKKWKLPIFRNISKSENWHMYMVKLLLDKYNLNDPVEKTGDKIGIFKNKELQNLYNTLIEKGSRSLKDALIVGATIEDLDIRDLQKSIKITDNKDINLVFNNLEKGSRNHLRAFVKTLKRYGWDYKPKYISEEYFNQIINSKWERGIKLNSNYRNNLTNTQSKEIEGTVNKIYTLPGLRKGIYWWMIDVNTKKGLIRVAIAPTWLIGKPNVKIGDKVEVKGYQGLYSFITCQIKDKNTGFEYKSRAKRCRNF